MPSPPLDHLRVIDLTDLRGALAGRLLADLGADVVKVEPPGGDPDRWRPPFVRGVAAADRSLPFLYRHANKRGVVIDLVTADGRRRLAELCAPADVLIENLDPERRAAYGLSPAAVRTRHPHLIHIAMADFGLTGPHAAWRAEPLPAFAVSGALFASGFPDRPPCWLPGYAAHDCAGVFAAAGALVALLDRARHGEGQTVEISVQEASLIGLNPWSIPLADYARLYPIVPAVPPRNADGMYLVLPATDGYVRVLPGTTRQWRGFLTLIGEPEALAGSEWEFPVYRVLNQDVIRLLATDALRDRTRTEVFAEALRLGVPLAPVNTPDEFVTEEQTRVRAYFRRAGFPHLGEAPFAVAPFNFSETPVVLRLPAPGPGEDAGTTPPIGGTVDLRRGDRSLPLEKHVLSSVEGGGEEGFWNGSLGQIPLNPPFPKGEASAQGARAGSSQVGADAPLLAGTRVIDLGVGAVGPEACWLFAELGAEVIKIESLANLDFLRAVTVEPDTPNRSWTFNVECRGQKSICLDLRTDRGRELALALCATADIVVENNRGGVVRSWGLDYDDVRGVRPDVIYLASQGFGRGGPLGEAPAFGPLNSCFAGANWLWNHPDAPYPAGTALNHPDHIASKLAAVAIFAALEHRRRTGKGQLIEMAQTEAAAFLLGELYLQDPCTGEPARPRGNAADYAVPHGVYPCAGEDRWCAIAVVGEEAFERFARCLGWAVEPRFTTLDGRRQAQAELDARVAEWTRARSPEEVAETLQATGVSAAPVQNGDDHRADPHLAARGAIVTVEHPEIGPERHIGNPLRMSRTRLHAAGASPLLGADTEDVLTRVLGLSREEVQTLVEDGVCR